MKNLLFALFISGTLFSQVGVNTTNPLAALDINGNLMIRDVTVETDMSSAKSSVLVTSGGIVKQVSLKAMMDEVNKTAVKGNFGSSSPVGIDLAGGSGIVPFDNLEFDLNNEFDVSTHMFTAKQDGMYNVFVHIKQSNLHISSNYGVTILKNGVIIGRNSFANISIATVDVTSPIRTIETLVELDEDDIITFEIESTLVSIETNITSDPASSFFTIQRIR